MFWVSIEDVWLVGTDKWDSSIETASILLILLIILPLHYGVVFQQNCHLWLILQSRYIFSLLALILWDLNMKLRVYLEASLKRFCLWWIVLGHARSFRWLHDAPAHQTTCFLRIWGLEERSIVSVDLRLEQRLQHFILCILELSLLLIFLLWDLCSIVLEALHHF